MIFIDLDGVLADFYKAFTGLIAAEYPEIPVISTPDIKTWGEGLTPASKNHGWRIVERLPAFWETLESLAPPSVFRRLDAAHKNIPVLFVTARQSGGEAVWHASIRWLERMGIREPVVMRHPGRGKKGELVPIWNPYFAIEDDPIQALSYAEAGVEVALLDWKYTEGITHPNITRCGIIEALSLAGIP